MTWRQQGGCGCGCGCGCGWQAGRRRGVKEPGGNGAGGGGGRRVALGEARHGSCAAGQAGQGHSARGWCWQQEERGRPHHHSMQHTAHGAARRSVAQHSVPPPCSWSQSRGARWRRPCAPSAAARSAARRPPASARPAVPSPPPHPRGSSAAPSAPPRLRRGRGGAGDEVYEEGRGSGRAALGGAASAGAAVPPQRMQLECRRQATLAGR